MLHTTLKKPLLVFGLGGLLAGGLYLTAQMPGPDSADVQQAARPMIAALEHFRLQTGRYPETLAQIPASQRPALPTLDGIHSWRYRRLREGYELAACLTEECYPLHYYESHRKQWASDF